VIFVDSNVWLYGYKIPSADGSKHRVALQIAQRNDVCLSSQVVNEVASNILRKFSGSEEYIKEIIEELYSDYNVVLILKEDILNAGVLRREYNFSYWDSLIVATALRANATELYSEDMQDGLVVRDQLTIRNPFSN
jgi:predicted nucleic acid-binding protein